MTPKSAIEWIHRIEEEFEEIFSKYELDLEQYYFSSPDGVGMLDIFAFLHTDEFYRGVSYAPSEKLWYYIINYHDGSCAYEAGPIEFILKDAVCSQYLNAEEVMVMFVDTISDWVDTQYYEKIKELEKVQDIRNFVEYLKSNVNIDGHLEREQKLQEVRTEEEIKARKK